MFRKLFLAALAAAAALTARPATSAAQKALVYCPTGADAGGCARIAQAIAGKFAQVDKAYDGTDGTIDLRTADLDHYAVIVVPSLADAAERTPYDLLRKEASRIRMAATGRVAVFSGAPDQGAANREAKDVVIANLVSWAAAGHTRPVGLVGLVAFQDLSEHAAARYDWVRQATPVEVSADVELRAFRSVQTQATARASFFRKGDAELAYPNMASYGLHIGAASPARTVSAATAGDAGQTVLVTYGEPGSVGPVMMAAVAGGDTAWIDTDKPDYLPGDTVTFTGGNWAAGDTVTITIHEDPHWTNPDRVVVAVADANGKFANRSFVIDPNDFGATFTATAVAKQSGRTAMDVFTDGSMVLTASVAGVSVTATVTKYSAASCSGTGTATTQTFSTTSTVTVGGINKDESVKVELSSLTPASATFNSWNTSGLSNVVVTTPSATSVCITASANAGGGTLSANLTNAAATTTTVNAATATYGDGSVTLSATVASTSTVGTGTVTFTVKDGSTTIGTATQSSIVTGGNASVSYALPAGTNAKSYTIEAAYNAGAGFSGSTGSGTLTIGKANQTITFAQPTTPAVYNSTFVVAPTASSGLAVSVVASGVCTISSGTVTMTSGTGTCTLTATQAGNDNYNAAAQVAKTVDAAKANQTAVTLSQPASGTYGQSYDLNGAGGSTSGTITYDVGSSDACIIEAGKLKIIKGSNGTCSVTATRPGDDDYNPASSAPLSVALNKATQAALTLTVPSSVTYGTTGTATATGGSGTGAVSFSATGSGCSVDPSTGDISVGNASGTCSISANKAGDDNYSGPVSDGPKAVTLAKASQAALSLTVPASVTYGTTGSATTTGGSGTGAVTFSATGSTGCSVDPATGVISVSNASGTCSISASKAGDDNYQGPVANGPKSVTLVKANQPTPVTLTQPTSGTYGQSYDLNGAGGNTAAAITYDVGSSDACVIEAGKLKITKGSNGTCSVTATRPGDDNYNAATSAPLSVTLQKANQSALSLTVPASVTFGTTGTATTTGGSGTGAVSFSAGSSTGCSVDATSGVISVSNASGTCSISASKAGDNNYEGPATDGPESVALVKANQTITFTGTPASAVYNTTFTVGPTTSSGLTVSVTPSGVCTINSSNTVTMTSGTGTCTLTASQAGDDNYNAATDVVKTVTATKAEQAALTLTVPSSITYGTTGTATYTGGSGTGAVTFSAGTSTGCSVNAATGVISVSNASGSCDISVTKATDDNYTAKSDGPKSVTLNKAEQAAVTLTVPSSITYGTTGTASATGGSGTGTMTYSATGSTGCAVDATTGVISVTNASGTCSVTATRAADNNYNLKSDGPKTVTLVKATATITLSDLVWPSSGPQAPTAVTTPGGLLTVRFTYDGGTTIPTGVGVYQLTATLDNPNYAGSATGLYVIYDPNAGFVTGGGWINYSGASCTICSGQGGRGDFGFVSKYQKGATKPSGDTQFEFNGRSISFVSTNYEWLTVAGTRAQFKGSGTINGSGDYGFLLTAIDGSPDAFRIKIWRKSDSQVVFDNQMGADDTGNSSTALDKVNGNGSIIIHSK